MAVFVVHEFVRDQARARANHSDLLAFIGALTGVAPATIAECPFLIGPFTVPGSDRVPTDMPFLKAKVSVPLPDVLDRKEQAIPKTWCPDYPLTSSQQIIVNQLRKGYTLIKGKGLAVTLKGKGIGPDDETTMRSVNGFIKRGIIDEALHLTELPRRNV